MAWNSFYGAMCAQLNVIQSYMLALIPSRVFNQLCLNLSFLRSNRVLYSCITLIERYLTPVYIESREAISGSFTMSASRWSASSKRVGCRGGGSERAGASAQGRKRTRDWQLMPTRAPRQGSLARLDRASQHTYTSWEL